MFSLLRTAHREFIIICIKKQIFTERWFVAFFKSIGNFVKHLYTIDFEYYIQKHVYKIMLKYQFTNGRIFS